VTDVRGILADVLGDPSAVALPDDTALLSGGLGLDSVTVVRLLAAVHRETGVDVADEDLDLDSLATIGTLAAFVAARRGRAPVGNPGPGEWVGDMRIGFVGAGNVGATLAGLFVRAGHEVIVSNSRGPATLAGLVERLGPAARAATTAEAGQAGDVVVVAIPVRGYRQLPAEPFAGKIVVDAGNYYPRRDGQIAELDSGRTTSAGMLADHLPGARVLKAFNTVNSEHLRERGDPTAPARDRVAIPVAGDDAEAKAVLTDLIDQIGFTAVDGGTLADSWRQEPGSPVYGAEVGPEQATALLAQARR
jgi:predicted dinucleotide-binding enzyme/acyl carrier protein